MKNKNLKNYILIALIISSVILTGKIWFDKKLWPEGYNFFAVITDKFFEKKGEVVSSLTKETISFPKNLVVTNVEKRSVYAPDSDAFPQILPDVKELLRVALESTSATQITADEWASALKSRSIHVSYPVAYDSKLFLNILGSYQSGDTSIPVRDFIITYDGISQSTVCVYIRNARTFELSKVVVTWDKQRLDNIINTYAIDSIGDLSYSTELNFDKPAESDTTIQKVVIDSNVLIQVNTRFNHVVEEINPLYDGEFNEDVLDNLLRQFGHNVSASMPYVQNDNSVVFVENYSTLKFHPNGLIEYKAVDASKGIDLKSGGDFYKNLLGCVDFVNVMWGNVFPHEPLNINISSSVIDTKSNSFMLTMEYFTDGTEINMNLSESGLRQPMNHAVEIEIVNGKIVSYRQVLAFYKHTDETRDNISTIEALDKLMSEGNMNGKVVTDLYPVYVSDGTKYRKSAWAVRTSDGQTVVIE